MSCFSRRDLLKHALTYAAVNSALKPLYGLPAGTQKTLIYVGAYDTPLDGAGNGKGIYLMSMDPVSGELSVVNLAAASHNASWLSFDPSGRYLYATNEVTNFEGNSGAVSAFAVDRKNGGLRLLNVVSSAGAGPAHLSVDASGKFVFVANYAAGTAAVLPILKNGALGPAVDVHRDSGSVGPKNAASGPPGSFAISGHDKPHAHMIQAAPGNRFVLQTDLGQDRIYVYALDPASGKLSPAVTPFVSVPAGDGPRHFTFHRNGRWLYTLQEEASTVAFFHFDPATGALHVQQTLSTLPPGFKGTSFSSEILLSPDQRFLYAVNRLHDSIAVFSLNHEGRLTYVGESSTMGDYPRHIQIDPSGTFLYACNQRSDSIASFRIDRASGRLKFTGQYTAIGSPSCIVFLAL
jgi:6-phosphogluconolactonase (cycloisomerase 2 family)